MHLHTVFFWLRRDLDSAARALFERELGLLVGDPNIRHGYVGRPATTDRPVIDSSYDHGLVLAFDDRAAHDRYQVGEAHRRFIETCSAMWDRVQVYDIDATPLRR